jgi:hypothetical protein
MISNLTLICTCPCCGKPTELKLIEADGKYIVCFSHMPETPIEDVSKYGIELGIIPEKEGG